MPPAKHDESTRRANDGARLAAGGIALNVALVAVKLAAGVMGNSYALIADGAESLLDIVASLVVWGGFRIAARPADSNHPFGHGKASALSGLFVGGVVLAVAAGIAFQSIRELRVPHPGPHWATLPVLAFVVLVKEWYARRMRRVGLAYDSTALNAEAWHHRSDALTSAAAFIGISVAVAGGDRFAAADEWAALAACLVIGANGVIILRGSLGEIMDTAVSVEVENRVRAVARGVGGVRGVEKCRVWRSGLSLLVDIHVQVDATISVREGHDIAHAVKDALAASDLAVGSVSVHIEPADG